MSTIRTSNFGPITGNTASVVDPSTPTNGIARITPLVSFAAVTASGTSVNFVGIPSWATRITVMFNNVSTNGSASYLLQIGSGSIASTGYVSSSTTATGTNTVGWTSSTAGFAIYMAGAAEMLYGHMVLTHSGSNAWVSSHTTYRNGWTDMGAGAVTLGGALDRVRLTTTNGTDTFDTGSVNCFYE